MTDREKLLGLFHEYNAKYVTFCDDCFKDTPEELDSKMYGLADHLLANGVRLETEQATSDENKRWIPVTERLPEKGVNVIVLGSRGGVYTAQYKGSIYWHKLNARNHMCEPTHWMPLPEPPASENV